MATITPSTAPTVDIESLLAPIPGDNPAGESLAYNPEYDQIREARRSDDTLNQGAWKRDLKVADWDLVVELTTDCLTAKTKDLQIAAWLAEALIHLHGFAGVRDGLTVMAGIQGRYWETYYPEIDDGDLESRHGPFLFLNDPARGLPFLIRSIPLTQGMDDQDYPLLKFKESRETDNLIRKDPAKEKQILATGRITTKNFDDAVAQTPKGFYARLVADAKDAQAAFAALDADTDAHFGRDAPSLLEIGKAIEEALRFLEPVLAAKRAADPDPEPVAEAPAPADGEGDGAAPADGQAADGTPTAATDGAIAFNGVVVPRRRSRLGTPQEGESPDFGRVLIDFRDRAQSLAEAGAKLNANREKYAELLAELKRLDDEYEELSAVVSRNKEAYQLLARLLKV